MVPHGALQSLSSHGPGICPPIALAGSVADEYLKTAKKVMEKPWELNRAASYLQKLVAGDFGRVPSSKGLPSPTQWAEAQTQDLEMETVVSSDLGFAAREAAKVTVHHAKATAAKSRTTPPAQPVALAAPIINEVPAPPSEAGSAHDAMPSPKRKGQKRKTTTTSGAVQKKPALAVAPPPAPPSETECDVFSQEVPEPGPAEPAVSSGERTDMPLGGAKPKAKAQGKAKAAFKRPAASNVPVAAPRPAADLPQGPSKRCVCRMASGFRFRKA